LVLLVNVPAAQGVHGPPGDPACPVLHRQSWRSSWSAIEVPTVNELAGHDKQSEALDAD
jgi:hypothetical protein